MKIKFSFFVLLSFKAHCRINDICDNNFMHIKANLSLIHANESPRDESFDSFEIVPDSNNNNLFEYIENDSAVSLPPSKYPANDPIFHGDDIYYKDNSNLKSLLIRYQKLKNFEKMIDTLLPISASLIAIGIILIGNALL